MRCVGVGEDHGVGPKQKSSGRQFGKQNLGFCSWSGVGRTPGDISPRLKIKAQNENSWKHPHMYISLQNQPSGVSPERSPVVCMRCTTTSYTRACHTVPRIPRRALYVYEGSGYMIPRAECIFQRRHRRTRSSLTYVFDVQENMGVLMLRWTSTTRLLAALKGPTTYSRRPCHPSQMSKTPRLNRGL